MPSNSRRGRRWSGEEDERLAQAHHRFHGDWEMVAHEVGGGRTDEACMGRCRRLRKMGEWRELKKQVRASKPRVVLADSDSDSEPDADDDDRLDGSNGGLSSNSDKKSLYLSGSKNRGDLLLKQYGSPAQQKSAKPSSSFGSTSGGGRKKKTKSASTSSILKKALYHHIKMGELLGKVLEDAMSEDEEGSEEDE